MSMGARRIGQDNWSILDANGVPLTTGNGASSACCDAYGPFGYFSEGSRTNLALQSQTFDNASWLKQAITVALPVVTADQTTAPDGTTTADKIVFPAVSGAGAASIAGQLITLTAAAYNWSVWLKGNAGGEQLYIMATPDGEIGRAHV